MAERAGPPVWRAPLFVQLRQSETTSPLVRSYIHSHDEMMICIIPRRRKGRRQVDSIAKEQWALALLTATFDCSQQKFFQAEYGRRRRSPAVALALCLTLGAFGAHEFYMGRLRSAVPRLLFCWTLIPLLLALVEASFLTRRVHAYNARMAHTLAEIVEETFAAVRADAAERAAAPAPRQAAKPFAQAPWQFGVARTFTPAPATRWPPAPPPNPPRAEERIAPERPSFLP